MLRANYVSVVYLLIFRSVLFSEVTKVRRNLFNEDMLSPSKRSLKKMPRSQSVSAVEGVKHKRSYSDEGTRGRIELPTHCIYQQLIFSSSLPPTKERKILSW